MCAASLGRVQERCRRLPFALGRETVAQAGTHRGGRCGRGPDMVVVEEVEEVEVEAVCAGGGVQEGRGCGSGTSSQAQGG